MSRLRTWPGQAALVGLVGVAAWFLDIYIIRINPYYVNIGLQTMLFGLLAVGLNWIGGYAGRLAFGNVMFFGIGSYVVEVGVVHHLFAQLPGMLIAMALCGVLAFGLNYALWKLDGLLFALVTFSMSLMLQVLFNVTPYLGRADGLSQPLRTSSSLVHLSLSNPNDYLLLGAALLLGAVMLTRWASSTRFGRQVAAVRDDRVAAATSGVNVKLVVGLVWAASAAFTAAIGVFYSQYNLFVEPESAFGTTSSVQMLFPAVIGGLGTAWGPLVGSIIIPAARLLNELAGPGKLPGINVLVYGCLLIFIVRLVPNGLLSLIPERWTRAPARALDPVEEAALAQRLTAPAPGSPPVEEATTVADTLPLLEISGVTKVFGGLRALGGVTFNVQPGEIVALIGPNGAGKTTLFNCITGVAPATEGTIRFAGGDITRRAPHAIARLGMSRTYQAIRIFPTLTAREHALIPLAARGIHDEERISAALAAVGLGARADEPVGDFSPVDCRRVELARAIVADAQLVLLDEAMVGLTHVEAQAMVEIIGNLRRQFGCSFVVVEHVMDRVLTLVDRAVVMDQGTVIAVGEPDLVLNSETVLDAYFGTGVVNA